MLDTNSIRLLAATLVAGAAIGSGVTIGVSTIDSSGTPLAQPGSMLSPDTNSVQLTIDGLWNKWPAFAGSVPGPCGGGIPSLIPQVLDPCESVRSNLSLGPFWARLQSTSLYKTWAKANPGEIDRLKIFLSDPIKSNGSTGSGQRVGVEGGMRTLFGELLVNEVVRSYWIVKGDGFALP